RRLLQAIPTLLGVSIISFFLVRSAPGDPILTMTFDPNITDETRVILRRQLGLDQPLPVQYVRWFTGIAMRSGDVSEEFSINNTRCSYLSFLNFTLCDTGGGIIRADLGTSIQTKQPVWTRISERIPATLELTTAGLLLGLMVGLPFGVLSAVYQGSLFDNLTRFFSVVGNALPNFWFGLILIFVFAVYLQWLPAGGRETVSLEETLDPLDRIRHLIMPSFVLALGWIALLGRFMRTETLEVIRTDYIRTAKAKGLAQTRIWFVHATRNALIPLVTILGPAIGGLLAGAVVTETIFAWPGIGRLTLNSAVQRDYPMVLGIVMVSSFLFILGNLLTDILYGLVDPRIRLK
ncbi:MAG TPA: ABC transporter permease, partial [Anaerolineae bacterium]|nr:ABC transporter permease [Anaerolineae bacterium]